MLFNIKFKDLQHKMKGGRDTWYLLTQSIYLVNISIHYHLYSMTPLLVVFSVYLSVLFTYSKQNVTKTDRALSFKYILKLEQYG